MFAKRFVIFASGVFALAACAPEYNPLPDYAGGYLMDTDRSRTVTVQSGDTLYVISQRYDVPTKVIADRNGLVSPYTLTAGQTLILDPTRIHRVREGDTLSSVAGRYDVDETVLALANELPGTTRLRAGQDLWIPDPITNVSAPRRPVVAALPPMSASVPPAAPAVASPGPIVSETLPPVASSASSGALLSSPVAVPPVAVPSVSVPIPAIGVPAAAASRAVAPEPDVAIALPTNALADPAPRAGSRFAWPVQGKVLARFGPAGKGLHNDGINIAAPAGSQVRAADNGVVAYAGNELKGFGNLLLLKHADGWTTAYAHNEKLLVKRGDKVTQGQAIATVGRTGNVDSAQLHFEVRKGTQALDPIEHLAAAGG